MQAKQKKRQEDLLDIVNEIGQRFLKMVAMGSLVGSLFALSPVGKMVLNLVQEERYTDYEGRGDIVARMNDALRLKGDKICSYSLPFDDDSKLNVRMEYICGPRGGGGKLRILVYLDQEDWRSSRGLDLVDLWLFSTEETRLSTKVYEVNYDKSRNLATYVSVDEIMHEADYIVEEFKDKGYTLLKVFKIKKKDLDTFLRAKGIIEKISDYQLKEKVIEMGNIIAGDHVWPNGIKYLGYGKFDLDLFLEGKVKRAPKCLDIEIIEGEQSIVGWALKAVSRDYIVKEFLGGSTTQRVKSNAFYFGPLDMKTITGNKNK